MAREKRGATTCDKVAASLAKADLPGRSRRTVTPRQFMVAAAVASAVRKRPCEATVAAAYDAEGGAQPTTNEAFELGVSHAKRLLLHDEVETRKPDSGAAATATLPPRQRLSTRSIMRKSLPGEEPVIAPLAIALQLSTRDVTEAEAATSAAAAARPATTAAAAAAPAVASSAASDAETPVKIECSEPLARKTPESVLHRCPHCSKTFMSRYGLVVHLDVHPKHTVRCTLCEIVFPSHRGLLTHRRMRHMDYPTHESSSSSEKTATSASGCSSTQQPLAAQRAEAGFSDITFADFSCRSFPLIAQHWCERRPRPSASTFHDFSCVDCNAAFPIASALQLHKSKVHNRKEGHVCATCNREFSTRDALQFHQLTAGADQSQFLQHLQLYPSCIRSKEVCVDDTHLNTVYHSLLVKVAGCQQGSPSRAAGDGASDSAAARDAGASHAGSGGGATVTLGKNGRNGGGSVVDLKNGQLRKSRRS